MACIYIYIRIYRCIYTCIVYMYTCICVHLILMFYKCGTLLPRLRKQYRHELYGIYIFNFEQFILCVAYYFYFVPCIFSVGNQSFFLEDFKMFVCTIKKFPPLKICLPRQIYLLFPLINSVLLTCWLYIGTTRIHLV